MHFQDFQQPSLSTADRDARGILAQRGNRLLLIEAILLTVLNVPLHIVLYNAMALVTAFIELTTDSAVWSGWMLAIYAVLAVAVAFLITLPSVIGLFDFARRLACGESLALSELFAPFFSSQCYGRALKIAWRVFWRAGLTVLIICLTVWLLPLIFGESFPGALVVLIAVAQGLVGALLWTRRFGGMAVAMLAEHSRTVERMPSRDVPRHAARMARGFFFGFLPWILLGLVTFGVLLLWDVLPRMLIAYFRYLGQTNEMIIQSEE